ncbi:MAG: primase-like DNA-binding domain-containing protein, partial [Longimicrobiales bacterium]|nr:primase-like DNA-binding domain-containing protein [Longimicrobiales bacterium]
PEAVTKATTEYRQEQDALGLFLEERCEVVTAAAVAASALYAAYRQWADATGEYVHSQRRFGQLLTERGFERDRGGPGGAIRYLGLNLPNLPEPFFGNLPHERDTRGLYGNIVQNRSDPSVRGVA